MFLIKDVSIESIVKKGHSIFFYRMDFFIWPLKLETGFDEIHDFFYEHNI